MAVTEYKRINLLTGNLASLGSISEDGTPAIWTDEAYRLGWLSAGSWRFAAMRDTSDRFLSLTLSNMVDSSVPRVNSAKLLIPGSLQDSGSVVASSVPLKTAAGFAAWDVVIPTERPEITGQRTATETLAALFTALSNCGLILDSTTPGGVPGAAWGCIFLNGEGVTAQSIPTGAGYTKITPFTTDMPSSVGTTPSAASDQITVTDAGIYTVGFTRTYQSGTVNVTWHIGVFVDGVLAAQSLQSTKNGVASAPIYADLDIPVECAAGSVIDVRVRHDQGGSVNLTYEHATLYVTRIA